MEDTSATTRAKRRFSPLSPGRAHLLIMNEQMNLRESWRFVRIRVEELKGKTECERFLPERVNF